jgi:hypothetical protein
MPSECEVEFVTIQGDIYRRLWVPRYLKAQGGLESFVNTNMGSYRLIN